MQTTVLCRLTFAQATKPRDHRPARVEVVAERMPIGVTPRYKVRTRITGADRSVFERDPSYTDFPKGVGAALAAAEFEFGEMPRVHESYIGGSDPDAHLFH